MWLVLILVLMAVLLVCAIIRTIHKRREIKEIENFLLYQMNRRDREMEVMFKRTMKELKDLRSER